MNYIEIVNMLNVTAEKVKNFESGDLIAVLEIKDTYKSIEKLLSVNEALKDIARFIQLLSKLTSNLSVAGTEKESLDILSQSNDIIINLFSKKIAGKEAAKIMNLLIKKIYAVFKNFEEKEAEKPESPSIYSDNYFSNIVDDKKMLSQLCEEAKEHLDAAQYTLIELEYNDTNQENLNKVFRSFHTIKGSSAFLGLKNFEEIGHEMESLLVLVRDGKLRITKDLIDVIFFGIEIIRNLVTIMETNDFEVKKIAESFKKVNIFDYIHLIQRILSQYKIKKIGEILQEEGKLNNKEIDSILDKQINLNKKFGEIAVEEKLITNDDVNNAIKKQQLPSGKKASYVKVSNSRLNRLIDIVGELVINQSMLKQVIQNKNEEDDTSEKTISQLEGITTNIKNLVLSMGMVPISEIFNRLRVVIRNTAQDLHKAVTVEIKGEDTELDRNVIESIYDPLVHMVRNSIDHGIEMPDLREEKNKDRIGKILVSAEHKGNGIEISVYDDGKGIDKEEVLEKALSMGIIERDNLNKINDRDIYNFMFLPGFSTAKTVTEISGRGVGLDVVKKNIEEIHGRIEVLSKKGQFTKFIIKLPLTLAIIEGFVTSIGDNRYVFPFNLINEIVVSNKDNINIMDDGNMMLFNRGNYIPVIFAGKIFKDDSYYRGPDKLLIIVISFENKNYGIAVDKVLGKQEIVIKNLGDALANLSVFSGGTIFGDGKIGFVVDIEGFLEKARI